MLLPGAGKAERKTGKLLSPEDSGLPRDNGKTPLCSEEKDQKIGRSKIGRLGKVINTPSPSTGEGGSEGANTGEVLLFTGASRSD